MDIIHKTHELFTKEDFTKEEIDRNNVIAVRVIKYQEKICKYCQCKPLDLLRKCKG